MEEDERYIETLRCIVDGEKIRQDVAENGMSDVALERQVDLNCRRHEMNIVDREEIIYIDENEKEFVQ